MPYIRSTGRGAYATSRRPPRGYAAPPRAKRKTVMSDKRFPSPEDIQQEFEDFVKERFGDRVKVFTSNVTIDDDVPRPSGGESRSSRKRKRKPKSVLPSFDKTPKEIKAHLDQFVIGQHEAKKALAIAVCDHYNQIKAHLTKEDTLGSEYAKQNVLILGPTGVGKTYLVRKIAELIGVPFIKADATRFSETGYVGGNVDDLVRDLVTQADGDIEKAQFGIVYLDEADKIANGGESFGGKDVNGRGVQFGLLRLMEDTDVDLRAGNDVQSQMQTLLDIQKTGKITKKVVNTRYILFIVSGAFSGLEKIIAKRLDSKAIGFQTAADDESKVVASQDAIFHHATTNDFVDFGFEPEFIGRLPVRVACNHLSVPDLVHILNDSEGSILKQYKAAFKGYGIDLDFTDEAIEEIARKAYHEKTGARALLTICENTLRDFKYDLPDSPFTNFTVTKEVILDPKGELTKLQAMENSPEVVKIYGEIDRYEDAYHQDHGLAIGFTEAARWRLAQMAISENAEVKDVMSRLLHSYEHAFKLVHNKTGQDMFELDDEMLDNPQRYMNTLILDSMGD